MTTTALPLITRDEVTGQTTLCDLFGDVPTPTPATPAPAPYRAEVREIRPGAAYRVEVLSTSVVARLVDELTASYPTADLADRVAAALNTAFAAGATIDTARDVIRAELDTAGRIAAADNTPAGAAATDALTTTREQLETPAERAQLDALAASIRDHLAAVHNTPTVDTDVELALIGPGRNFDRVPTRPTPPPAPRPVALALFDATPPAHAGQAAALDPLGRIA